MRQPAAPGLLWVAHEGPIDLHAIPFFQRLVKFRVTAEDPDVRCIRKIGFLQCIGHRAAGGHPQGDKYLPIRPCRGNLDVHEGR